MRFRCFRLCIFDGEGEGRFFARDSLFRIAKISILLILLSFRFRRSFMSMYIYITHTHTYELYNQFFRFLSFLSRNDGCFFSPSSNIRRIEARRFISPWFDNSTNYEPRISSSKKLDLTAYKTT